MLRRFLPAALVLFLTTGAAFASTFSDVSGYRYRDAIEDVSARGIIEGYDDPSDPSGQAALFRPSQTINRAELLKILMESVYPDTDTPDDLACFTDFHMNPTPWYAVHACKAKALGVVRGYADGSFKPEQTVNLVEAIKMTALSFGFTPRNLAGNEPWYAPYADLAREKNALMNLLHQPAHLLTRGEAAELIKKFLDGKDEEDGEDEKDAFCGNSIVEEDEQCDDGNLENGDGCSEICVSVPEPIRHAHLLITQESTATVTRTSAGKTNVPLLRFRASAGRQDVLLTSLLFKTTEGSLLYAKQYEIVVDRNGDGTFETLGQEPGKTSGNSLLFDDFAGGGILIPEGDNVRFELRADVPQTSASITLGVGFKTEEDDYIGAVGADDGRALTGIETDNICVGPGICWINVKTRDSGTIEVSERGNLYVTKSDIPVGSRQLLASTVSDPVLRLTFETDGEDMEVTDLRFEGIADGVEELQLFRANETSFFARATMSQCGNSLAGRLCADIPSRVFVVAENTETDVIVRAKVASDGFGAESGETFTPSLSSSVVSFPAVEARGIDSTQSLLQNDGDGFAEGEIFIGTRAAAANAVIAGAEQDIVLAKIIRVENGLTIADGEPVPTGIASIGAFRITAGAHSNTNGPSNDVALSALVFSVSSNNIVFDPLSFRLSNEGNPGVVATCTGGQMSGVFTVTCANLGSSPIQSHISQAQTVTYVLRADITNAKYGQGSSSLVVSLQPLGDRTQTNAIVWSDEEEIQTWVDAGITSVRSTSFRRD